MRRTEAFVNALLVSTSILAACSIWSTAPYDIQELLDGGPDCRAPCVLNITPGQTTRAEALERLSVRQSQGEGEIALISGSWNVTWTDNSSEGAPPGRYYLMYLSGIISRVRYVPPYGQSNFDIAGAISIIGEPEAVAIGQLHQGYTMLLYFPSEGVILYAFTDQISASANPRILPETPIQEVHFQEPGSLQAIVDAFNESYRGSASTLSWEGYGEYPRGESER